VDFVFPPDSEFAREIQKVVRRTVWRHATAQVIGGIVAGYALAAFLGVVQAPFIGIVGYVIGFCMAAFISWRVNG
jgi:hypothetical protein